LRGRAAAAGASGAEQNAADAKQAPGILQMTVALTLEKYGVRPHVSAAACYEYCAE
jgi:hypothetical protein